MRTRSTLLRWSASLALAAACGFAQSPYRNPGYVPSELPPNVRPPILEDVGIDEHLGAQVNLDLELIAEDGYPVKLRKFFHQGRPVILNLVYYECPQLCSLILNAQVKAMREIPWTPGNQYEIVTISIDPREAFDKARQKKAMYLSSYDRPAPGWNFLTDAKGSAKMLAGQVGFKYAYDKRIDQYAHPAAIMVLTPKGKVARYLYGITYQPRDLRFALAEASEDRFTMAAEKVLLFCYQYDAHANRYVLFATNFMKAGGILVMAAFGWFWFRLFRADRRRMAQLNPHRERTA
jgi:protein SCO1/2